jgi:hypothetical protein
VLDNAYHDFEDTSFPKYLFSDVVNTRNQIQSNKPCPKNLQNATKPDHVVVFKADQTDQILMEIKTKL